MPSPPALYFTTRPDPGQGREACRGLPDGRASSYAEMLGVDEDALRSMAGIVYDDGDKSEKTAGRIVLEASIEGIHEAVELLKVLEAQLHGARAQTEKIGAAIDALQLKLENRIESVRRPDR